MLRRPYKLPAYQSASVEPHYLDVAKDLAETIDQINYITVEHYREDSVWLSFGDKGPKFAVKTDALIDVLTMFKLIHRYRW